jgi:hypothetical protein
MVTNEDGTYRDGTLALPFLIASFVLLAIGAVRTDLRLPATGGGRGGSVLVAVFGVWWSLTPWLFPVLIVAFVGLAILTVAARRNGVWSRVEAGLVVGGMVASLVSAFVGASGLFDVGTEAYAVFFVALTPIWLGIGRGLLAPAPGRSAETTPGERPGTV